jgi:protein-S-isoprenylcysteine O-methyltransferase Ste14
MGIQAWLTVGLSAVWFFSELALNVGRRSKESPRSKDRLSLLLMWSATVVSIGYTVAAEFAPALMGNAGKIPTVSPYLGYFGCLLMVCGLVVRFVAIATLNKQFTVNVAIVKDHEIVDKGLYSMIRHPSYSGTLLTFLGLGLAFENWISLIILCVLPLASTLYRISVEEGVLVEHFGPAYEEYKNRTKALIPGVL